MRGRVALAAMGLLLVAAGPQDKAAKLLDALKMAPSAQQAEALEMQISLIWRSEVSPAVQVLVDHGVQKMAHQDPRSAIGDLDAALDLDPDSAELWRLHAEARFANGDDVGAYEDLAQALSREKRCFPALADLSHFAEAKEDWPRALSAWQKLLEIDPRAKQGEARLHMLERKAQGEPL
jgi:tetratricopeptide (TPR) repeat protein